MNINEKKMIDFNNKRHLKEKELERKIDYVKQNYPKIKKINHFFFVNIHD